MKYELHAYTWLGNSEGHTILDSTVSPAKEFEAYCKLPETRKAYIFRDGKAFAEHIAQPTEANGGFVIPITPIDHI